MKTGEENEKKKNKMYFLEDFNGILNVKLYVLYNDGKK